MAGSPPPPPPPPLSGQWRAYALLALVMLLWAGNSIVGRAVRADIPPFTLALGRWLIATLVVLPFALPNLRKDWRAARAGWWWILVLGFFGIVCFNALIYSGLHYTTATNALLLQASIPAGVLALDRMLHGTRAKPIQLAGVALSTLGVLAIVLRGDLASLARLQFGRGDMLVLGGVVAWSFYTVLLRRRPDISGTSFLLLIFALGALVMAPLSAFELAHGASVHWSWSVVAAYGYVGLFPSVVAYIIYNAATAKLGAGRAGQAITLMPLFGALLSVVLLGEQLARYHVVGMALILAGIVLSALALRHGDNRKSRVAPQPVES
ncbi:hypothetical protein WSK_3973 [Novosphingobium sp. Rr 2-17]|uniref:DMT family transporter n=1 Tax=Novosphingobium sp. Rr 2-17 TaxID=555793 RepID=UPI000269958C|nr:DMT family transporter [Novosphingobium sp. Rr 2-17]EIZ77441.1 hypothetical protein WSK_3973 [Novosphingobium sp. Rr 2-17]